MTKRREFIKLVGRGTAGGLLLRTLPLGVGGMLLMPRPALAAVRLDPNNPEGIFTREGNQGFTPGGILRLDDASNGDIINFFASDSDAAPGIESDIIVRFQVQRTVPDGADNGVRFGINDGEQTAVIAACITKNGQRGIGLFAGGFSNDPSNYPDSAFVQVDWGISVRTLRVRRTAQGEGEIVELDGVPPSTRKFLTASQLAPAFRLTPTFEFGCRTAEAEATIDIHEFYSERVGTVPGVLMISRIHIRDASVGDVLRLRADFELGASSDGIDPSTQPVSIRLSTPAGVFYPPLGNDFNPVTGFQRTGSVPRRRWMISDAERARTGIQAFVIDEDPNNRGKLWLVDRAANLPAIDYSNVQVELQIGNDLLVGTVNLAQTNSGGWRGG